MLQERQYGFYVYFLSFFFYSFFFRGSDPWCGRLDFHPDQNKKLQAPGPQGAIQIATILTVEPPKMKSKPFNSLSAHEFACKRTQYHHQVRSYVKYVI